MPSRKTNRSARAIGGTHRVAQCSHRKATRGRQLPLHALCHDLGGVQHAHALQLGALHALSELQEAPRIAGHDRVDARLRDLPHLRVQEAQRVGRALRAYVPAAPQQRPGGGGTGAARSCQQGASGGRRGGRRACAADG